MTNFESIVLGIVEGLTEFLPVSSTAHLKFTNPLLGIQQNAFSDMFEVVIQLAAILAVVLVYWRKFFDLKKMYFYVKLIIAVIPALIGGLLLKKHIDGALSNLTFIACVMLAGGIILLFIDRFFKRPITDKEENITNKQAFIVGCFQVLSIIFPGLSRSAATIVGGLSQKMTRRLAAEFSFFLAVPTMVAASAKAFYDACKTSYLDIKGFGHVSDEQVKAMKLSMVHDIFGSENLHSLFNHDNTMALVIGCVVSFIVALLAVKFFIGYVQKHGFQLFGWYRIALGIVMLGLIFSHII